MPNYRTVEWVAQEKEFKVIVRPLGWRRGKLLSWLPYVTGNNVALNIRIEPSGGTEAGDFISFTCVIYSNLGVGGNLVDFYDFYLPHELETPIQYISAPGEYFYNMQVEGAYKPIADFSASAVDRLRMSILVVCFAVVAGAVGAFIVNLVT